MSSPQPPEIINEADKPFVLVLIGTLALVGILGYSLYTGKDASQSVNILGTLVSLGWGFYFKSKT